MFTLAKDKLGSCCTSLLCAKIKLFFFNYTCTVLAYCKYIKLEIQEYCTKLFAASILLPIADYN